ncbi:MGMT family protein [Streptomyces sp. NRRL S-340]|uniref:MGMT family protein n=1 Tax=Streptomyces sp. NRRL S-340 TaxID=1463901 RepID=UPI000A714CCB|nr:MGMT family protein [Streptomyces sp. NRRL S-340]
MSLVEDVREAVLAVPAGSVTSYGAVGRRIGAGPRQVGRVMGLLDEGVPWWRVVHADGTPRHLPRRPGAGTAPRRGHADARDAGGHDAGAASLGVLS